MSGTNQSVPKKVTKIIRKDGITYRPAGGTPQPQKTREPVKSQVTPILPTKSAKSTPPTSQGKKKTLGKVIKRADGTKIVVVDGKIVKTLKPNTEDTPPPVLKPNKSNEDSSLPKTGSYDEALSPLTDISADELPPEVPSVEHSGVEEKHTSDQDASNSVVSIKRTITFNQRNSPAPLLEKPKSPDDSRLSTRSPVLTKSFNVRKGDIDQRAYRQSHSSRKGTSVQRPSTESRNRQSSKDASINRSRDHSDTKRSDIKKIVSSSNKRVRRSRSPKSRRTRSPAHRNRSPTQSRGSGKYRASKRARDRSRSKSPKIRTSQRRSLSPKKPTPEPKPSQNAQNSLTSLLSQEDSIIGSKENILNMIQKQAEDMLQAQHSGPIDEDKKIKLREAMESILEKRGLINASNTKTRKESLLRSASSDSSDGRESPQILEKLHQKYNTSTDASTDVTKTQEDPLDMEAISPCIDNISVASNEQKVSDVSHSDMEMSDEESKNDNEDGKTPAFRKKPDLSDDLTKESTSQIIQIKLGKDEDEEVFQALAARVDGLKTSSDVQELIQAIESRIKSYLSNNIDPSNLEKKIKRYQTLVAKVVIEAESIKEKEDDDKVTYHTHRRSRSKEVKTTQPEFDQGPEASVSYPVQTQEPRQPWLYQNPTSEKVTNYGNPETPLLHNLQEPVSELSDYEKVHAQYVSQRVGYHVCLLCMIESSNESHFQKHLSGKKHHDAVLSKIRQLSATVNVKKFKRHDLVIKCKLCDIICRGQKKYNEHTNHRSHLAIVQAYVKIGRVIPEPEILHHHEDQVREQIEEIQESGTPAVGREYMSVKTVTDCDDNVMDVYYCSLCKTNCNSEIQVEKHVRSKKHYLIYIKVTQPDVNVQVNAGEHKKRRETTKKLVSTMKTIKQMEEIMERNRDRIENDASVVPNEHLGPSEMPSSMTSNLHLSYQARPSTFPSYSSSPQAQLGPGPIPMKYQNQPSSPEKMKSNNAPYYRDPNTRLSSSQQSMPLALDSQPFLSHGSHSAQLSRDAPMSSPHSSRGGMSNSQETFALSGPSPHLKSHSGDQEQFTHHDRGAHQTYNHQIHESQNYHSESEGLRSSRNKPIERFSNFSSASSVSAPHPQLGPYGSASHPSANRHENQPRSLSPDHSIGSPTYNQSGRFNEHQAFVAHSYNKQHDDSNSHPKEDFRTAAGPGSSYGNRSDSNYINRNHSDQALQPANTSHSFNSQFDSHHKSYAKQAAPREMSWANKSMNEPRNPVADPCVPSSGIPNDSTFNSAAPSNQSYSDHARNTYRSAYNRLKQGDVQPLAPASSYGGPTFSSKPTYSGVYTNVRRG